MKVKLNSPWRGYKRNETIDVPEKIGESLIVLAIAVAVPQKKKATRKTAKPYKPPFKKGINPFTGAVLNVPVTKKQGKKK